MVFIAFFVLGLIVVLAIVLLKIMKEQADIAKKEEQEREELIKKEEVKVADVMNDTKFQTLLNEAKNDPDKLDSLRRTIQDTLRKSVKEKNVANARICNIQLKKIDFAEGKGNQK